MSTSRAGRLETIYIDGKPVGADGKCFIIAEAGVAHFGDLAKAKKLVNLAVDSGADAVKFQTFDVDALITNEAPEWRERLGNRCLTSEEFVELKAYCDNKRITFLSTAHDEVGLETVKALDPPAFKIGSGELGNWGFMQKIADLGKPVILSTGMYSEEDVAKALKAIAGTKNNQVALLHCVTSYPTASADANIRLVARYKEKFGGVVGYSDHTEGATAVLGAVALGAKIIEKHIALDFNIPDAQDWRVSAGPDTFPKLVKRIRKLESCLGEGLQRVISDNEMKNREWACKSLVAKYALRRGQQLEADMLLSKRPGTGISPEHLSQVIGRELKVDLTKDSVIRWHHLSV